MYQCQEVGGACHKRYLDYNNRLLLMVSEAWWHNWSSFCPSNWFNCRHGKYCFSFFLHEKVLLWCIM